MPKYLITGVKLGNANTWSALQTFSPGIVSPSVIGGTGTTSTLTLQSTSGVGAAGADIIFKVGNNGATEAGRILNGGQWGIGGTPTTNALLQIGTDTTTASGGVRFGSDTYMYRSSASQLNISNDVSAFTIYASNAFAGEKYYGASGAGNPFIVADRNTGNEWARVTTNGYQLTGANGQKYVQGRLTELVAVDSGLTTKATTIQIPADAIVYAVPVRVNTQPGGTANFTVTATTSGTAFQKGANISTAAGTTDPGTKNTPVNYNSTAAQTITFTFNAATTDALGVIRVDILYHTSTPPTS